MLDDFLELMAGRGLVWGESDCALALADWVSQATGCADPAEHLRGRYSSAFGAARFIAKAGGLDHLIGECAASAGLKETSAPGRGDIGVLRLGSALFGAICTGSGSWVIQSSAGLFGVRGSPVIAWEVPCA